MSKNIIIQEGGIGKQLTVDKLKTNLVGGGTCLWVPEDEVQLTTKFVTKNGTYKASDDGYYGYSEVSVSGIGTATGTGSDGEMHSYTEDGSGGITDIILPDSIVVVTPPTLTTYTDGLLIDFSGMVVKAYLKSGNVWTDYGYSDGVIPTAELTLPVKRADKKSTDGASASSSIVDGPVPTSNSVSWSCKNIPVSGGRSHSYREEYYGLAIAAKKDPNREHINMLWASGVQEATVTYHYLNYWDDTGEYIDNEYANIATTKSYTYDGKTVYYRDMGISTGWEISDLTLDGAPYINGPVAWTIVFGSITGGKQTIPVQWVRPVDGKMLASSFEIDVR